MNGTTEQLPDERPEEPRGPVSLDILVADDDEAVRESVAHPLRAAGHRIKEAATGAEAIAWVDRQPFDVVVCDVRLPKVDGLTVLRQLRRDSPDTDVIMITAYGEVADAVASLREGAYDYMLKPFDTEEFTLRVIGHIVERRALKEELKRAREQLAQRDLGSVIVGHSPPMRRLLERIETFAQSDSPVLVTGESGTGKELVARSLHAKSRRATGPFVAVNCAAFPDTLLEAELFGHERGALTGAVRKRDGRFKAASGGTLLLDEIAEIPLPAQAKLLRALEEGAVQPLGTNASVPVDVRLIAATHRNLRERIADGRFREDLFYRLNVLDLAIPPLRERTGDLPLLLAHFLKQFARDRSAIPSVSPRAWAALSQHSYPGNVREFAHAVERSMVLAGDREIDVEHLPSDVVGTSIPTPGSVPGGFRPLGGAVKEFERQYILRALQLAEGGRAQAAELLGISRKNLWEKLRQHGIRDDDLQ